MISSSGFSAFSRLFSSMRRIASWRQPLQRSFVPRAAVMRSTSCASVLRPKGFPFLSARATAEPAGGVKAHIGRTTLHRGGAGNGPPPRGENVTSHMGKASTVADAFENALNAHDLDGLG